MKQTLEVLQILQGTPLPNLFVIAGLLLVLLGFAGKIGAIIELPPKRQKIVGFLGFILLIFGAGLFVIPGPTKEADIPTSSSPPGIVEATLAPPPLNTAAEPPTAFYTYEIDYGGAMEMHGGGGGGGNEFYIFCPTGYVASGLIGGSGMLLDRVGLECRWLDQSGNLGDIATTEVRGGEGGSGFTMACSTNQFLVGIRGRSGDAVDQLGGYCQNAENTQSSDTAVTGGSGGNPFDARCPAGYAITGINGRSGVWVDQVNIICNKVSKIDH
jgi:hypothetical protein